VSRAPDAAEPLIGYRAWQIDGGRLMPAGQPQAGAWERGIVTARCLALPRARAAHRAPGAKCTCGLYALASPRSHQLRYAGLPIGAIAAWGEIELHRTGFRAEHARVIALALPRRNPPGLRAQIQEAAAYYEVPAVPESLLESEACRHGRPVSAALLSPRARPRRANRAPVAPRPAAQAAAAYVWPERHVFAQYDGSHVVAGPTPALWAQHQPAWPILVAPPGRYVVRGATIACLSAPNGIFTIASPLAGQVMQINPTVLSLSQPETQPLAVRAGWVVRIRPISWTEDLKHLGAAPNGDQRERAVLDLRQDGVDVFAPLREPDNTPLERAQPEWTNLPCPPADQARRFADTHNAETTLGSFLRRQLDANTKLGALARQLGVVLSLRLRDPAAQLTLDLREQPRTPEVVHQGSDGPQPDVALDIAAADAHRFCLNRLDLAAAVRSGQVTVEGSKGMALSAMSVLGGLREHYEQHLAEIGWHDRALCD
jgi:glycine cleavage system H lipoate-binding protein